MNVQLRRGSTGSRRRRRSDESLADLVWNQENPGLARIQDKHTRTHARTHTHTHTHTQGLKKMLKRESKQQIKNHSLNYHP